MSDALLARQLRRAFSLTANPDWRQLLATFKANANKETGIDATQLESFVQMVRESYEHFERDISLRTRSLELSSAELMASNAELRAEAAAHRQAMDKLRQAVNVLTEDQHLLAIPNQSDDLQFFANMIGQLVNENAVTRKQLQESEQRYRRVVNSLKEVVFKTDWQGIWLFLNPAWHAITGFSVDESLGRSFLEFVHPEDRKRYLDEFIPLVERRADSCNITARYLTKAGDYRWIDVFARLILDDDGNVLGTAGTLNDVTETREAERALKASHTRLFDAIDNLDAGVLMLDEHGRVRITNQELRSQYQHLGIPLAPGTPMEDILRAFYQHDATLRAQYSEADYLALRLEQIRLPAFAFQRQLGERHIQINHHRTSDGGTIIQHTDITASHQHAQELARAKEAAENANRSKSDFLANMSHEIRTPMNGVLGMIQLALDTELDDEQREFLRIARSSAEGLLSVINEILDFSKIEAGHLDIHPDVVQPDDLIHDCLKAIAHRAQEKGLVIYADIDPTLPSQLLTDPVRLRQIMTNLIGNAIKFTEQGTVLVSLTSTTLGGKAAFMLQVQDSGIGIAEDKLASVFGAFEQADSSTTRRYGGTGLGLTICRRIVEQMGGTIRLSSVLGQGSNFIITLPYGTVPLAAVAMPIVHPGKVALLQESHPGLRANLQARLERRGITCHVASSTDDLCTHIQTAGRRNERIDLIMLSPDGSTDAAQRLHESMNHHGIAQNHLVVLREPGAIKDTSAPYLLADTTSLNKPLSEHELDDALQVLFGHVQSVIPPHRLHAGETRKTRPGRLLLVEDNAVNRQLALRLLTKLGCTHLDIACSGEEALEQVRMTDYDLILMDIQMPDMSGLEATAEIRQMAIPKQPVIVAMTARAMMDDKAACLAAGMNDYLSKPIEWQALADALDKYLPVASRTEASVTEQLAVSRSVYGNDPALWQALSAAFVGEAGKLSALFQQALTTHDKAQLARVLSTLAGIVAHFAPDWSPRAQALVKQLQQDNDPASSWLQAEQLHDSLTELISAVRAALEETGVVQ
ncbi:ATP-binding protein [Chitinimonas naiadis]